MLNRINPVLSPWRGPPGLSKPIMFGFGYGDVYIFTEADNVVTSVEADWETQYNVGQDESSPKFSKTIPNPFNPETWIPYRLAEPSDVQISIYSQTGELIRDFNLGHQAHGEKTLYWDGKNRDGETVASGIYFYQFKAGDTESIRKMWLMK